MKKVMVTILSLLSFASSLLFAQTAPDTTWTKTYSGGDYEWGRCVKQTSDGGYIIVGDTKSFGAGNFDVWLIKTGVNGDTMWTKTFGGISEDRGYSVQQTTDEGYIIAGTTSSYGTGGYDIWLIKTDSSGNSEWTKTFGGNGWEWGYSVQQTTDGGYVIVGFADPTGMGIFNVRLIKTDSIGNNPWIKTFGGSSSDGGKFVRQTSDGGYIIVGDTYSFGAGSRDVYLIKTNSSGDTSWTKTFGGSDSDGGYSVRQTSDNGYIVVGYTESFGAGDEDVWLIRTDAGGDTLWTKTFGGTNKDGGESVQQTVDGGFIVAGYSRSYGAGNYDFWLIKTDSSGNTLWTKTIGGSDQDWGRSVQQTTDGGYIVVGDSYSFTAGWYNIRLIKLDQETGIFFQTTLKPDKFNLANYPNPFNSSTIIEFETFEQGRATVGVYNLRGQKVKNVVSRKLPAGKHSFSWNGTDNNGRIVSTGIYFYRVMLNNKIITKKMTLVR